MNRFTKFLSSLFVAVPLRMLAIIGAGVVQTTLTVGFGLIVWKGGWDKTHQEQQLWYLGVALLLSIGANLVIIGALTSSKIKGTGPAGVAFEIESSDPPQAVVTTRTMVETPSK